MGALSRKKWHGVRDYLAGLTFLWAGCVQIGDTHHGGGLLLILLIGAQAVNVIVAIADRLFFLDRSFRPYSYSLVAYLYFWALISGAGLFLLDRAYWVPFVFVVIGLQLLGSALGNISSRLDYFRHVAEQGNPDAQFLLAQCYERGTGVRRSDADAFAWYDRAATGGNHPAQVRRDALAARLKGMKAGAAGGAAPEVQRPPRPVVPQPVVALKTIELPKAKASSGNGKAAPLPAAVNKPAFRQDDPSTWTYHTARNASCPCGSGKKYKYCHGQIA